MKQTIRTYLNLDTLSLNFEDKRNFSLLNSIGSLALATPCMLTALEIGVEGVHYDAECKYALALERYTAALESLIALLRNEPKGRRKDLLRQQVKLCFSSSPYLIISYHIHDHKS